MADQEYLLQALSISISEVGTEGDPEMTAVVNFTVNAVTHAVTIPEVLHDGIRHLLAGFGHSVSTDILTADLFGGKDYTVTLIPP